MRDPWTVGLGAAGLALSALALGLWIPGDVETGVIEVERRRQVIGDAFAPTMVAAAVALVSAALVLSGLVRRGPVPDGGLSASNGGWVLASAAILGVSLAVMTWAGPLSVALARAGGADLPDYRLLIDTAPWKYIGYVAGGFLMVLGFVAMIEHRLSLRTAAIALAAAVALAAVYDLPFDDILLPPNGDQ